MDVPTIPERYVVRQPALDICSDDHDHRAGDTFNCHRNTAMNREQIIIAGVLLAIILIGNLGGIIWALNW